MSNKSAKDCNLTDDFLNCRPINGTPDNLIEINQYSGVITVKAHRQIDCDDPPRFSLQYLITLYDGANETEGEVN